MIVCDKCGKSAEYFISVDYLGNKNMFSFDLCEQHYNEVQQLISEKEDLQKEPVNTDQEIQETLKTGLIDASPKRKGRPKKNR